jgi:hypothetical protein
MSGSTASARAPHPLLHPARELPRIVTLEPLESDGPDEGARDGLALRPRRSPQLEAEGDRCQHVRPRKERGVLEHHRALGAGARDVRAVDRHGALVGGDEPGQDPEEGRLAAPARTDQAHELVRRDREAHVGDRHRRGRAGFAGKRLTHAIDDDHSTAT